MTFLPATSDNPLTMQRPRRSAGGDESSEARSDSCSDLCAERPRGDSMAFVPTTLDSRFRGNDDMGLGSLSAFVSTTLDSRSFTKLSGNDGMGPGSRSGCSNVHSHSLTQTSAAGIVP